MWHVRLKKIDRDTPKLMAVDMRDWIPEDHMVHFILEAIPAVNLLFNSGKLGQPKTTTLLASI